MEPGGTRADEAKGTEKRPATDPGPLDYANPFHALGRPTRRTLPMGAVWLIVLGAGLLLFGRMLIPSTYSVRGTATRVKSASNLRQIGQAIFLYSGDHQGDFPDSFQTILLNEDISSSEFVSPLRNETPADGPTTQAVAQQLAQPGHLSYVYLGRGLNQRTATPAVVLSYELPAKPEEGGNVLFGDYHVEFFDAPILGKIIEQARTGKFPVTMPSK